MARGRNRASCAARTRHAGAHGGAAAEWGDGRRSSVPGAPPVPVDVGPVCRAAGVPTGRLVVVVVGGGGAVVVVGGAVVVGGLVGGGDVVGGGVVVVVVVVAGGAVVLVVGRLPVCGTMESAAPIIAFMIGPAIVAPDAVRAW